MKKFKIVVAGLVMSLASPAPAQTINPNEYRVPFFSGLRAQPDFNGDGQRFHAYRTALRNGFANGPVVAGHYALISIGCGMECLSYFFGDLRTGKILPFPIGGEYFPSLDLKGAPDSRLIVAKWGDPAGQSCTVRIYAMTVTKFEQVGMDRQLQKNCFHI
jgi:hypothetical protein